MLNIIWKRTIANIGQYDNQSKKQQLIKKLTKKDGKWVIIIILIMIMKHTQYSTTYYSYANYRTSYPSIHNHVLGKL